MPEIWKEARTLAQSQTDKINWREWIAARFPAYVRAGFAPRHIEFWEWVWAIAPSLRPPPFVAIWPRGGAKSTSAELAVSAIGIRGIRRYIVYCCETQEQADNHVSTIAGLLETAGIDRAVYLHGRSKGWRRNRLRAANGFTIDALGMDTAARGLKVEAQRPDMIVLDDIDSRHDTAEKTQKKIATLTDTVLPTGSNDCAVLAVQNLIHSNSIFARLSDGRADFLSDRIVSGPFQALLNFKYEANDDGYVITGGEPTWDGQDVAACQGLINTIGPRSFIRECQQDVKDVVGALWQQEWIDRDRVWTHPPLVRVVVGVDPEAVSTLESAETGIIVAGRGEDGRGYILHDASLRATPAKWGRAVVEAYRAYLADYVVGESNNGGEMVSHTIVTVRDDDDKPIGKEVPVTLVHASRGKVTRADPVSSLSEHGRIAHVGYFPELEDQLTTWLPGQKSPDRLDAFVWAITELGIEVEHAAAGATAKVNPPARSAFSRANLTGGRFGRGDGARGWHKR